MINFLAAWSEGHNILGLSRKGVVLENFTSGISPNCEKEATSDCLCFWFCFGFLTGWLGFFVGFLGGFFVSFCFPLYFHLLLTSVYFLLHVAGMLL